MEEKKYLRDLDVNEIQQYQQNRPPILFLDYVEEVLPGVSAKGFKNFTHDEWYFAVHFKDDPNVPGFVQIEALTQLFLMTFLTLEGNKGKKTAFVSIEKAVFKKKIIPGDRLDMKAELHSYRKGIAKGTSEGYVQGVLACKADLVIAIPDVLHQYIPK